MSEYAQRQKVYALLQRHKFDNAKIVVGAGNTYSNSKNKMRFEFNAANRKEILEKTAEYAVKYYSTYDFYLLWKVAELSNGKNIRRTIFSASYYDVMEALEQKKAVRKGVEYPWWGEEKVEVLSYAELEKFIVGLTTQKREADL